MFLVQAPLLLVAALHVSPPSPPPQQAPRDTAPEAVVVDLRIGRLTGTTLQAYRVRSEVLLPLSQFFQLAEIRHRLTPDGRLEATVDPGNRRIVIDPRSDSMEYGDRRVRIEREFIRFETPELYVGSERLGDLLGVMFVVDWSDLTATVVDPSTLPIAVRLRREAAREAYLRRPDGMRPDVTLGVASRAGRWRHTAAVSLSRSIPRTRAAASQSICRCVTARIPSILWRTARSVRSASSTGPTVY